MAGLGGHGRGASRASSTTGTRAASWTCSGYTPVFVAAGAARAPGARRPLFLLAGRIERVPGATEAPRLEATRDALARAARRRSLRAPRARRSRRRRRTRSPPSRSSCRSPFALKPEPRRACIRRVFVTADGARRAARSARARRTARSGRRCSPRCRRSPAIRRRRPGPQARRVAEQRGPRDRRREPRLGRRAAGPSCSRRRRRGRWPPSTTSPGATPTTSPTSTSRPGTCSTRSAGPTTCSIDELTPHERERIRASLERHAALVYEHFTPSPKRQRFEFTQNHDFIPTAGLAVAALALHRRVAGRAETLGGRRLRPPPPREPAAVARRLLLRGHRVLDLLDAVARALRRRLGARDRREPVASSVPTATGSTTSRTCCCPNGQDAFDFGDVWEGPLTRERRGEDDRARSIPAARCRATQPALPRRRAPARSARRRPSPSAAAPSVTRASRSTGRSCGGTPASRPHR